MTTLSKLLASAAQESGSLQLEVPADWMQGRSVFGGLQVAFALQAMRALVPSTPLRTLQTTFIGPVSGSMRAQARILRQGKNVTHVEARLGDDTAPQAIVIGAFGSARSSAVERGVVQPKLDLDPARVIEVPLNNDNQNAPHFAGHFGVRWLRGMPPFTGDTTYDHVLEVGIDDTGDATEAHLIAIADYPPPVALSFLKTFAPGSTLTWMLQLLTDDFAGIPLSGFRIHTELVAARDGYTSQAVTIYAPDGTALALSQQSMLVFG
jgi:acyl-coenzyme A thioesterase PaaI-like protein